MKFFEYCFGVSYFFIYIVFYLCLQGFYSVYVSGGFCFFLLFFFLFEVLAKFVVAHIGGEFAAFIAQGGVEGAAVYVLAEVGSFGGR